MFEKNVLIGGAAGQGLDTSVSFLGKILTRAGYHIFISKDFMSRVRGGHNFYRIRISDEPMLAPRESLDMVFCFNEETQEHHEQDLIPGGLMVGEVQGGTDEDTKRDHHLVSLPVGQWAGKDVGNPKTISTVSLASIGYFLGVTKEQLLDYISEVFKDKLLEVNQKAIHMGYDNTVQEVSRRGHLNEQLPLLPPLNAEGQEKPRRLLVSGSEAIGMSAIASGCKFLSTYPMTPSTGILTYMARKQKSAGIVVEQSEDEIAGINMALGAASAGVRAMTTTSGGGFSLMVEAAGLSGVGEIPLVIVEMQRPGPATGLPTRTEQGDLLFAINASQSEFPRVVMSVTSIEDAFYQTNRAFELAEKYQIPVMVMGDQHLGDATMSLPPFDFQKLDCQDYTITEQDYKRQVEAYGGYVRYELTENGISPRAYPGQLPGETVLIDSHEHDMKGKITEDKQLRKDMVDKRMKKLDHLQKEMSSPTYEGVDNPDLVLVGWGSTRGVLVEATQKLKEEGYKIGLVHFSDIFPLPDHPLARLKRQGCTLVTAENNATGQLAKFIAQETAILADHAILRYDGRALTVSEVMDQVKTISEEANHDNR